MYLKSIELVGFKSFANRTKLDFEPGMTAIVGPNGCGKSNVSDAIRWVLGEQSAKALRGGAMTDCIFNGTEDKKALGMAEVSITLADCEESLGTEFHEVTVTRRVFKTGEGAYFMNRAPCRLKDIQRLFMDTGIGTNSYSLMEQGRIDRILSSRPDDRREVFEEASGITKFKADKKEAIRKLEHTEANLDRLSDIIREVKRQIISLQRQAGKAKRYRTIQDKLRGYELYATQSRLSEMDEEIHGVEIKLAAIGERDEALRADVEAQEKLATETRAQLACVEDEIAQAMDAAVEAKTELDRTHQLIQLNKDRISELQLLSERDSRDAETAQTRLEEHRTASDALTGQLEEASTASKEAEEELAKHSGTLAEMEAQIDAARKEIEDLRTESVDLESRHAKLQNELSDLEARERSTVVRRERLFAEKAEMERAVETYEERQRRQASKLEDLRNEATRHGSLVEELNEQRSANISQTSDLQKNLNELETRVAGHQAQLHLLRSEASDAEPYPRGAQLVLNSPEELELNGSSVVGALADHIEAEPAYRIALEAVLRSWLDAIVIKDDKTARTILKNLEQKAGGAIRLLAAETAVDACPITLEGAGEDLVAHVQVADHIRPMMERLLSGVRVVESLHEIPYPVLPGITYVTQSGVVMRDDGSAEYWMQEAQASNPLTRRHLLAEKEQELEHMQKETELRRETLQKLQSEDATAESALSDARQVLETSRRSLAVCEGENQIIAQEVRQARERAETVTYELKALTDKEGTGDDSRTAIHEELENIRTRQSDVRAKISSDSDDLRAKEQNRSEMMSDVTECRVRAAERRQHVQHLIGRKEPLQAQIQSLESLINERAQGVSSYESRITDLADAIEKAQQQIQPLQEAAQQHNEVLEGSRKRREEMTVALTVAEKELHEKRNVIEQVRSSKSRLDIELAEHKMRRQNTLERITSEYRISAEQVMEEPEPEWDEKEGKPDQEALETSVAEMRAKLESMGPVNLVAIEEHKELEERYAFLTQQQDDLVKAKQQLMDMIRTINKTTTELFSATFNAVNENFQVMFKQMFGGGSAKLVLVDDENVLESGIEIIARPPGKKLQTVSLLSGGERTLTAVALLFSLYQVKPSPFCVLDELDAALDDTNIGRFVKVVKGFLEDSQFIVITHNRQTISAASVLYGVTMEKRGISKIVSVKFSDHEKPEEVAETSAVTSDL